MSSRRHVTRVAGWAAAGVLAAGAAGVGIAHAASPSPSPTPSDSAAAPGGSAGAGGPGAAGRLGRKARGAAAGHGLLARRLLHGEMVVRGRDGTPTTVDVQRGKVTAVSATSITVRSDDGFTATYAITATTRVRVHERGATSAQIDAGDTAAVTAHRSGDRSTAQAVVIRQ